MPRPKNLSDLNPSLLRMTTPKDREFELHVPAGTARKFQTAVAAIPADKRVWWRYHKVQSGETLSAIAHTYHTTPQAIAEANGLESESGSGVQTPAPETRLIIPIAPGKQTDTSTYARALTHYKIRKGDTVESVAENFGVSAKMLRSWNHLKGDSLAGRKVLYLHLPVTKTAPETQVAVRHSVKAKPAGTQSAAAKTSAVQRHTVKQGETLYSIASSYNTTVQALQHDNRNIAVLRPGMILIVRDAR